MLYVITTLPDEIPVTIPLPSTVATEPLLLLQLPPPVLLLSIVVPLTHTLELPLIAPGRSFTNIICTYWQPAVLYVIPTEPADTPDTTPDGLTVAIDVLPLLQLPPPTGDVRVVVLPTHTLLLPLIDPAPLPIVTTVLDEHPALFV